MSSEIIINGTEVTSVSQIEGIDEILIETQDHRLIRCDGGNAEIQVTQNNILISSKSNYINVNQFGTTVDGKVHLAAEPQDIRINGFWVLNTELLTTLPSTIYTPIPVLVYNESPAVKNIQQMTKFLRELS